MAQRISSINSISSLCEETGADIKEVSLAIGTDKELEIFFKPGPGLEEVVLKDIKSHIYVIIMDYTVASYWQKVVDINNGRIKNIRINCRKTFGTITGKRIAILGFSFKANTNDIRESPAITIIKS